MKIDLDAKRAARAEAQGETPEVIFGGETFVLPSEMPFRVMELAVDLAGPQAPKAMRDLADALLEDRADAFMTHNPSVDDFKEFLDGIMELYALTDEEDEGNEQAS